MNIIESKLKNGVWYNGLLWKERDVISPNEWQDFILIERISEDADEMYLLDANNDEFYPNTPAVAKIMKRRQAEDRKRFGETHGNGLKQGTLRKNFLSLFKDKV